MSKFLCTPFIIKKSPVLLNLTSYIHRFKKRLDFSRVNICNKVLNFFQPDIIINCAAKTDVDFCEKNKKVAYNSNAKIVKNLTSFCNKYNKKIISWIFCYNKIKR